MSTLSTVLTAAKHLAVAALEAVTGTALSGAPAPAATALTVGGTKITFGMLTTTVKTLQGSDLGAKLERLVTHIGDIDNDFDVTEQVAGILAPYLPIAGEVATAIWVLKAGFDFAKTLPASTWAPAPRPGPPLTEADWSHGFPGPQPVTNPSGAIGGDPS